MKLSSTLILLGAATAVSALKYPYYERGWDFEGGANDLGNAPGKNIEACFTACATGVGASFKPKCGAVSYWQGTCYFKAKRGTPVPKGDVDSTAVYATQPPPYPPTEANKDYVDNDITSKQGDLADCPKLCQATTGCRAYSWLSGTCYLKKARGTVIDKQGVTSGLAYPETSDSPTPIGVLADTDFVDHDIGNKPSPTAEGCIPVCKAFPGCHAFSWSNWNGVGTCWLKAKGDVTKYNAGIVSSKVDPDPRVLVDLDFSGGDIGSAVVRSDVKACQDLCLSNAACKYYTWVAANKHCYLKSAVVTVITGVLGKGKTSGVIHPTTPGCNAALLDNQDIANLDIASRSGIANYDDCSALCDAIDGCTTYSWSDYMGGTCWLKQSKTSDQSDVIPHPSVGVKSCKKIKLPWE